MAILVSKDVEYVSLRNFSWIIVNGMATLIRKSCKTRGAFLQRLSVIGFVDSWKFRDGKPGIAAVCVKVSRATTVRVCWKRVASVWMMRLVYRNKEDVLFSCEVLWKRWDLKGLMFELRFLTWLSVVVRTHYITKTSALRLTFPPSSNSPPIYPSQLWCTMKLWHNQGSKLSPNNLLLSVYYHSGNIILQS